MKTNLPPKAPFTSRCTNAPKRDMPLPPILQPASFAANKDQGRRGAKKPAPPALRSHREPGGEAGDVFSNSWPKMNFQLGRRPQPRQQQQQQRQQQQQQHLMGRESVKPARLLIPKAVGGSCDSGPGSLSGDSAQKSSANSSRNSLVDSHNGGEETRFTLSLTPEAVLVIQKRDLERRLLSRKQLPTSTHSATYRCSWSSDPRCKRLLGNGRPCPHTAPPSPPGSPADITTLLKISLLNDRHKYDDVEYEEEEEEEGGGGEAGGGDVMEKCLEWLKGVESAHEKAAGVDLPHLS